MARPKAPADPDSLFTKGVMHGLTLTRNALTDLHRRTPAERAGIGLARSAVELTIANERAERGLEPEALELLARIEALRNGPGSPVAAANGQLKPAAPKTAKPAPEKPKPAPELAAAFAPVPISGPDGTVPEEDPHEADTEAPGAPEPGDDNEPDAAEEWAEDT